MSNQRQWMMFAKVRKVIMSCQTYNHTNTCWTWLYNIYQQFDAAMWNDIQELLSSQENHISSKRRER